MPTTRQGLAPNAMRLSAYIVLSGGTGVTGVTGVYTGYGDVQVEPGGTDEAGGSTRFPLDPAESPAVPPVTPVPPANGYRRR